MEDDNPAPVQGGAGLVNPASPLAWMIGGGDVANMTLEDIERLVIERTLQRTGGNKQAAANLLGIYRPRLYSKIRKYNIDVTSLVSA